METGEANRLEAKNRSRAAFDAQAATYDEDAKGAHSRVLYPFIVEEVVRSLSKKRAPRILDMGCGTGALTELVADALPACALAGIDLSENMARKAFERLGARAEIAVGDAERLPFEDSSFDLLYCNDSFHHYPNPRRVVEQMHRVLVSDGVLVIGDCWLPAGFRAVMNAFLPYSAEGDVRIYSEREMRDMLKGRFASISWRRIGLTASIATARKGSA